MNYILFPKLTEVYKYLVGLVNKNKYEWERDVRENHYGYMLSNQMGQKGSGEKEGYFLKERLALEHADSVTSNHDHQQILMLSLNVPKDI